MLPNHGVAHEKPPESSAKPGIQTPDLTNFLANSPKESETGSLEPVARYQLIPLGITANWRNMLCLHGGSDQVIAIERGSRKPPGNYQWRCVDSVTWTGSLMSRQYTWFSRDKVRKAQSL